MLSIGPYVLVVAIAATVLACRLLRNRAVPGIVSGLGLVPLWVAWNNRAGPGESCWQTETAQGCTELYDPFPWALAGIVALVAGVTLALLVRRFAHRTDSRRDKD